eukprot:3968123-Alexandrium_andersonii.AAC.1
MHARVPAYQQKRPTHLLAYPAHARAISQGQVEPRAHDCVCSDRCLHVGALSGARAVISLRRHMSSSIWRSRRARAATCAHVA